MGDVKQNFMMHNSLFNRQWPAHKQYDLKYLDESACSLLKSKFRRKSNM